MPSALDRFLAPKPATPAPAANTTWLGEELKRQRDAELAVYLQSSPPPDRVATANRVSRQIGLPAPIVDNDVDGFASKQQTARFLAMASMFPRSVRGRRTSATRRWRWTTTRTLA